MAGRQLVLRIDDALHERLIGVAKRLGVPPAVAARAGLAAGLTLVERDPALLLAGLAPRGAAVAAAAARGPAAVELEPEPEPEPEPPARPARSSRSKRAARPVQDAEPVRGQVQDAEGRRALLERLDASGLKWAEIASRAGLSPAAVSRMRKSLGGRASSWAKLAAAAP